MAAVDFDSDELLKALAFAVRERRKELGISQEDLSYNAGFARGYLGDIERAARSVSIKSLTKVARALGLSASSLLKLAEKKMEDDNTCEKLFEEIVGLGLLLAGNNRGLILTDPKREDNPIVFVSPGFENYTGFPPNQSVGKNCRFLQADDRNQLQIEVVRLALRKREQCSAVLRNYRKDNSLFFNFMTINPLFGESGDLIYFLAFQREAFPQELDHKYKVTL